MAFNETLAGRVRALLARRRGITERKMFGGLAFMVDDHMACGILQDDLMLRLGDEDAAAALDEKHVRAMDFTGRPMKSMVYVGPGGTKTEAQLKAWVERAVRYARSLPPKE